MKRLLIYLAQMAVLFCTCLAAESNFTMEEALKIVKRHNELRAIVIPPAANMEKMVWDDRLAEMAQDWAGKCVFEHGQAWPKDTHPHTYIGQNIWIGTKTQNRELTSLIVQDWWDEIKYYTYKNHSCIPGMICGHYTQQHSGMQCSLSQDYQQDNGVQCGQVATAESVYVGCGRTDCTSSALKSLTVVCNYQRPMSNPMFPWPYKSGSFCSKCKSGSAWCEDGLCAECKSPLHKEHWPERSNLKTEEHCDLSIVECALDCYNCGIANESMCRCECAPGWDGLDCAEICKDADESCPKMLPPGRRVARCHPMQYDQCKLTCGQCSGLYDDSEGLCCDGMLCENGGLLDTSICTCLCHDPYIGDRCETEDTGDGKNRSKRAITVDLHWLFLVSAYSLIINY